MAKEYIEREALLCMVQPDDPGDEMAVITIATAKKLIRSLAHCCPAADVAPVRRGRWIEEDGIQICSECGEEHEWEDYRAPYCDTCGAQMDEKAVKEEACQNGGN